ncbi:MAG TPA: TetR/AcrR family transcriptional regulator [Virgibacillus sp.]|nr:TetR/AcrR family transcriptional regulator [Virgibacillus sp.]
MNKIITKESQVIPQPFNNLEPSKQKRIIDAALKEFAENGYERASTNQIVKHAEIGKGMLFYYFENKQGLYHYLIDYAISTIEREYLKQIYMEERDFIERFSQITEVKMTYHYENPNVSNFISNMYLDDELDLPEHLEKRLGEMMEEGLSKLYEDIDYTLFREDIDVEKAFQLIRWSMEGYQNDLLNELKGQNIALLNLDPYWDEFYEYLAILKTTFYKTEEE